MLRNVRPSTPLVVGAVLLAFAGGACGKAPKEAPAGDAGERVRDTRERMWKMQRERMVKTQIKARGVKDPAVLQAMRDVERHKFVPAGSKAEAYTDHPVRIGEDQTISQPYIVGLMTELIEPEAGDKVLEIGTGSGYQAAVLAEIVGEVYTIEIIESLGLRAKRTLDDLGYSNVHILIGDGYKGWPDHAPFDAIMVTAAPDHIPPALIQQLKTGGRMVIPVGESTNRQRLLVIVKTTDGHIIENNISVRFVPMTGEAEE